MKERLLDWLFDFFGERYVSYTQVGDSDYMQKRIWKLKLFGKTYERDYDKEYNY